MPAISRTIRARIPTESGEFHLFHYTNTSDRKEHLAVVMGDVAGKAKTLVRVHSECFTGDVLGSLRCDCGEQLTQSMQLIAAEGSGVLIYLRQEGRGIGLEAKLQAYNLQDEGYDTVEANLLLGHQADEREYWAAAGILADLDIPSIRLMTNNPAKIEHLEALGITVTDRVPLLPSINAENAFYLDTKIKRMRHMLDLPPTRNGDLANHAPARHSSIQVPTAGHAEQIARISRLAAAYFQQESRPFITLSYAQSLDGSIARTAGAPTVISGAASLRLTHRLRAAHDAVLVGVGTVLADDPRLDVRLADGPNPAAIVLDTHLRTPPDARLFERHQQVWIVTAGADSANAQALSERGARLLVTPVGEDGRPDLSIALARLGAEGVKSIMVEGGAEVIHAFLIRDLACFAAITVAPRFLGGLPAVTACPTAVCLPELSDVVYTQADRDLMVWGALPRGNQQA
ncbi:MAG: GTP cyclohydrolase II [Caldilineaceae bacterium]|nr:GTP cyclohydrolase II [Caldilineaceae bacterium]